MKLTPRKGRCEMLHIGDEPSFCPKRGTQRVANPRTGREERYCREHADLVRAMYGEKATAAYWKPKRP